MYKASGKLVYYDSWWLSLKTDDEICRYYKTLINQQNKSLRLNLPKHGAHVTVISGKHEVPPYKEFWRKYQDETVEFLYEPIIHQDREYFWMRVECERFGIIRTELGLPAKIPLPTPWHLTIANLK